MKYLMKRNGRYIYNRRIPNKLKNFDTRQRVRISLNTKCEITAIKRMIAVGYNGSICASDFGRLVPPISV